MYNKNNKKQEMSVMRKGVKLQAHKGVECEYPENTMVSFVAAVEQGYEMIELDLGVTKDKKIVTIHDNLINRTARNIDGSEIKKKIDISDLTYEECKNYDFGIAFSEKFRGTEIPLFEDVLKLAADSGTVLKIDNKIKKFSSKEIKMLFDMINKSGARVLISCWNYEIAEKTVKELPLAEISFDGLSDERQLEKLSRLAGKDKFYVWMPVDFEMASWADKNWFITDEKAEIIKKYAKLCIWAIKDTESFEKAAERYSPYAAETKGNIKPE